MPPKKQGKKKMAKAIKVVVKQKKKRKTKRKPSSGMVVMSRKLAPVARASVFKQKGPRFNRGGSFRVRNREMVTSLTSTAATWDATVVSCQPGVGFSFPWLSQVADGFKEYRFRKLKFFYEPNCSSATTGAMVLIPSYNADDAAPSSVVQAMDYKGAINIPVWQKASVNFNSQKFIKNLFVRTTALSSGTSALLYDTGAFIYALDNVPALANFGKIMAEYDVEFFIPTRVTGISSGYGAVYTGPGSGVLWNDIFEGQDYSENKDGEQVRYFPDTPNEAQFIQLGSTAGSVVSPEFKTANTVLFTVPGIYGIDIIATCGNTGANNLSSVAPTGGIFIYSSASDFDTQAVGDKRAFSFTVQAFQPNATFGFSVGNNTQSVNTVELRVVTLPNSIYLNNTGVWPTMLTVMPESTAQLALKLKRIDEAYLNHPLVRVLPHDQFIEYRKTGIVPKRTKLQIVKKISTMRDEIQALLASLPDEDDEDFYEKDGKQEIPETPRDRGEIQSPVVQPMTPSSSGLLGLVTGLSKKTALDKKAISK